jgi:putative component of membrane protein insertase Oxa1/YidC/SpoIIIJ protein YidD
VEEPVVAVEIRWYAVKSVLWAVLFLLAFPGFRPGASAADPEGAAAPTVLDYALFLYEAGDPSGAAAEAGRFLFFHPRHPRAPQARSLLDRIDKTSAERPGIQDPGLKENGAKTKDEAFPGFWENVAVGLIHFYQEHLRTFKNPQSACPSYPECSVYTIQAVKKHGTLLGTFMLVDRLWRETGTAGTPPFVRHQGRILHYDPLEWNDYWLVDR